MTTSLVTPPYEPLTPRQFKGLLRLGDVIIPGEGDLPNFSDSGTAVGIDKLLPYMYDADRQALNLLLNLCAVLPKVAIRQVVRLAETKDVMPGPLAPLMRFADIGIKGVPLMLYWSDLGSGVFAKVGYAPYTNTAAYDRAIAAEEIRPGAHSTGKPLSVGDDPGAAEMGPGPNAP